jgi:hypothetical protein
MHSECPSSDGTPRFISFGQWFYMVHAHGRCRSLMQVIDVDDSSRRFRYIWFTDSITWMHSECLPSGGTPRFISFGQRFYMVHVHGRCRWLMQVIDVDDSLRRFRYIWFNRVDHMNALWVPVQWWNTTFYKLWAMVFTWFTRMIDAGHWCRWLMLMIH